MTFKSAILKRRTAFIIVKVNKFFSIPLRVLKTFPSPPKIWDRPVPLAWSMIATIRKILKII